MGALGVWVVVRQVEVAPELWTGSRGGRNVAAASLITRYVRSWLAGDTTDDVTVDTSSIVADYLFDYESATGGPLNL